MSGTMMSGLPSPLRSATVIARQTARAARTPGERSHRRCPGRPELLWDPCPRRSSRPCRRGSRRRWRSRRPGPIRSEPRKAIAPARMSRRPAEQNSDVAGCAVDRIRTTRSGMPSPLKSPTASENGAGRGVEAALRLEGAVAPAQQDRDVAGVVVRDHDVGDAVAVEDRRSPARGGNWEARDRGLAAGDEGADGELAGSLEGAVAVAQQHADRVRQRVGDDQVELAVAVEVGQGDLRRPRPGREQQASYCPGWRTGPGW